MLRVEDKAWLAKKYPNLTISSENEIAGLVSFKATYNNQTNKFQILEFGTENSVGGLELEGSFNIKIKETTDKNISLLPGLYVDGIPLIDDRHINQTNDKRACLCSPFVEHRYLDPDFDFKIYFERLVIPFLYGQLFYDREQKWPWSELSHGVIGLFESYYKLGDSEKMNDCIERLKRDQKSWPNVKSLLLQKNPIKGHTPCICGKSNSIRNCHIEAWYGIEQLRKDLKINNICLA